MAKYIRVTIETGLAGDTRTEIVELEDEATEQDCEDAAKDEFYNVCSYGWLYCDKDGDDL